MLKYVGITDVKFSSTYDTAHNILKRANVLDERKRNATLLLSLWMPDPVLILELACSQPPIEALKKTYESEINTLKKVVWQQ
jgi:hypothetical protein